MSTKLANNHENIGLAYDKLPLGSNYQRDDLTH